MRHRHAMLMDLLRLCHNDICQCLPTRDIMADELEKQLFHEYLLYDMGLENTRFVGREAVSNGYHECDFTLEIEDIMKEPHQAIPRTRFRYLRRSLPESRMARGCTNTARICGGITGLSMKQPLKNPMAVAMILK